MRLQGSDIQGDGGINVWKLCVDLPCTVLTCRVEGTLTCGSSLPVEGTFMQGGGDVYMLGLLTSGSGVQYFQEDLNHIYR